MLMEVKPGIVLTSFSRIFPVRCSRKKSTRAMPNKSSVRNARTAYSWNFLTCALDSFAGITRSVPSSRYFAGNARLRILIAQNGKFNFAAADRAFHHDFLREFAGEVHRGSEFFRIVRLGHAYRTSQRRRLHENGETEFLANIAKHFGARFFPFRAWNRQEISHGQLGLQEQPFLYIL